MTRNNPTTIDETTWFYSDAKGIDAIHEFYEDGQFKKNARFHIPRRFVDELLEQSEDPNSLRALVKYVSAILLAEYETLAKEKELEARGNVRLK